MTTATLLDVRPLFTEEGDYALYAQVHNSYYPDDPVTPESKKASVAARTKSMDCRDYVALWEGVPAAVGINMRPVWMQGEGIRLVHYAMSLPFVGGPAEAAFLEYLVEDARALGARRIHTPLEDHHPSHVANVEAHGFELSQRQLVTRLDVRTFDASRFAGLFQKLDSEGVAIRTMQELGDSRVGWRDAFYEAHRDIERDVPSPDPIEPMPQEDFWALLENPAMVDPRGVFAAFQGAECLGVTSIMPNPADPKLGLTRLTGVRREHRRRGIATALKARCLDWAKSTGIERVLTDNEEHNPMYKLNRALGFEDAYRILVYSREAERE